jgi:hypothetical protein
MTVHMVRLLLEPPKGNAENAVDNWVTNHNEWEDDPVEHTLTETTARLDGSGTVYLRGDYRFIQEESPTALLDDLISRLDSFQGGLWYRVGYHECPHDDKRVTGESWTATVGSPAPLNNNPASNVTVRDGDGTTFEQAVDYTVATVDGTLTAVAGGDLVDRSTYLVDYDIAGPCSWDKVREDGDVPADIPQMEGA